jgi:hypothetical protein
MAKDAVFQKHLPLAGRIGRVQWPQLQVQGPRECLYFD